MPEADDHEQLKDRAVRSVALVAGRGVAVRIVAFLGVLVLARLLAPSDFGILAIGYSLLALGTLLADGGLGAALIRQRETPTHDELRAILGFQLVITVVVAAAMTAVAPLLGDAGPPLAIMAWSLPLATLQVPGAVLLERELAYGTRVTVELAETVVYYGTAVTAALLGYGITGVAAASLAKGVAGALVMWWRGPVGPLMPRLRWAEVRANLSFGLKFQAIGLVNVARDQGLSVGVAVIAGTATLGYWSLAYRIMQPAYVILESLWRVAHPAASRTFQAARDLVGPAISTVRVSSVALALVLVPLAVGSGPLVAVLFGPAWAPAASVLPLGCIGLLLLGPSSVAASALAYARGDLRVPLLAAAAGAVVWLGLAFALVGRLGVIAVGIGWLGGCIADGAVCARYLHGTGVPVLRLTARSTVAALVVIAAGWPIVHGLPQTLLVLLLAGALSLMVVGALVALVDREAWRSAQRTAGRLRRRTA